MFYWESHKHPTSNIIIQNTNIYSDVSYCDVCCRNQHK